MRPTRISSYKTVVFGLLSALSVFGAHAGSAYSGGYSGSHSGSYIGLDGTSLSVDNSLDDNLNPRGLRLRLGVRVSDVFDIEAHLGGGSDSQTLAADKFSAVYAGLFLKGHVPIGQRSALFALGGVSGVDLTQRTGGLEFSDDRSGFSYGFGLETQLSEQLDLSADYVRYVDGEGEFSEVSAVNLGIKWYF